jgi:flagellar basal body-associated protein FliL
MSSHKKRVEEKYTSQKAQFQEKNKKMLCIINVLSTVVTTGLAMGTLIVLNMEEDNCATRLRLTLWLMLIMHATNILESVCQLTGLEKLCCGLLCCLAFFVYEVAVIVYMNVIFFNSDACAATAPKQYWWLLINIIVYFFFFFIAIIVQFKSWFSKPSTEEVEKEVLKDEIGQKLLNAMH